MIDDYENYAAKRKALGLVIEALKALDADSALAVLRALVVFYAPDEKQ